MTSTVYFSSYGREKCHVPSFNYDKVETDIFGLKWTPRITDRPHLNDEDWALDFDMARYVVGSEIVSVYATGAVRIVPEFAEIGDLDTVAIMLQHANGAIMMIDNSRQAVYGYDQRVEVFGSKGMTASENPMMTSTISRNENGTQLAKMPYFFLDRYIPAYIAEWNEFMGVATGKIQPVVTGADGRASLVAGLAAWKSVREGRVVKTSEIVS
jgi:myo-inositol 2-dehydrogenase/D-chiro-inositol 1-dehydrogenase